MSAYASLGIPLSPDPTSSLMDTPTWLQIGSAVLIIGFLIFLWPRAKHWAENSPKAEPGDWPALVLPLLGVVAFVTLLIMSVQ